MSCPDPVFVHLRLHSEFSITDGIVRLEDAVERSRVDRMGALALTDLSNLFGWVKFYVQARKCGVKPIAGADIWVSGEHDSDPLSRLLLLARSPTGYAGLCRLLSSAWRTGRQRGKAVVERATLAAERAGLIVLSGAAQGDVGLALGRGQWDLARARAQSWQKVFGDDFYLELQRTGAAEQEALVQAQLDLASSLDLPVVATHPIQFLDPEDFKAHEARVCIAEGQLLADPKRTRHFTEQQYFKTQEQMAVLFADLPEALQNAVEISKRCNLELALGKPRLPDFATLPGASLEEYMVQRARTGLELRLEHLYPEEKLRSQERPTYLARLEFECNTILQMGFAGYFLIVADFIQWARTHEVPVGPGRGSGAGSLVAYCLEITDLDPLRYDLLFERFLNPERVSMPDFDIDFCQDGRDRVIDYVRKTYGSESVSQIATFGTMAAKAVIRDVGRVLDLPYGFVDQLAKLVPFELGITLARAREQEPQLEQRAQHEEEVGQLLALAQKLEGITRNVGMHAGGVLIAPGRLTDFTPLYCQEGSDAVVSQYDKDDVEKVGLVKFDFLGLRTLTILDWTERHIRALATESTRNFRVSDIPLDDSETYALFCSGATTAVFQQESRTAKDLEKRLQPDCFEDIIALMALNRPGPLQSGMVDDFIHRKHGRARVDYFHHSLEPVLRPTYGVIVYQEQVMQIAQVLAGYTLGGADLLRRAMGKKDSAEMARHRTSFIDGATARGTPVRLATQLFDLMEKFAEYGFNKSHSAAYALISYQTAWLKCHYPAQFMAATLSGDLDDTDKVAMFVEDARRSGLEILPVDINTSAYRFMPVDAQSIRYGLGSVKGTGEAAALEIVRVRQEGAFQDLFDFCQRVDRRIVNRRVVDALIKAGAFDRLGTAREVCLTAAGLALENAEQTARQAHQGGLFDSDLIAPHPAWPTPAPWTLRERLVHEKNVLGFYFSAHPFSVWRQEVRGFAPLSLQELPHNGESCVVAGVVSALRIQQTRRGRMGVITLEDDGARLEVVAYSELFEEVRNLIQEDQLLVVQGKSSLDTFTQGVRLTAERLMTLEQAREHFARELRIEVLGWEDATALIGLLRTGMPGDCPLVLDYTNTRARCELRLPPVRLSAQLLEQLALLRPPLAVEIVYALN